MMTDFEMILELQEQVDDLTKEKNAAYQERNQLVAALSRLFPSSLERHQPEDDPDWDEDWKWVVFIEIPDERYLELPEEDRRWAHAQVSWHIHDSELPLFDHLERNKGTKWDGHTTEEKYKRLERIADTKGCAVCGDSR